MCVCLRTRYIILSAIVVLLPPPPLGSCQVTTRPVQTRMTTFQHDNSASTKGGDSFLGRFEFSLCQKKFRSSMATKTRIGQMCIKCFIKSVHPILVDTKVSSRNNVFGGPSIENRCTSRIKRSPIHCAANETLGDKVTTRPVQRGVATHHPPGLHFCPSRRVRHTLRTWLEPWG